MIVHINIGTNCGHRAANIDSAVSLIACRIGQVSAASRRYESDPWGYDSPNRFLNMGVNVQTDLEPEEVMLRLLQIEQEIAPGQSHRTAVGTYADRIIDLDLICAGQTVVNSPVLQLPHPRLHLREFVLLPLAEIWPDWEHPQLGFNAEKMIERLGNKRPAACVEKI